MNMTRKNFLRWSAFSVGGVVLGTALPACGGGGGGGGASAATVPTGLATPTAVAQTPTAVAAAPAAAPAVPGFTAGLAASRISGVAPLYVNFDATGTTHPQSTNPTHELFYSWMFGDSGAGSWANGVQSAGLTSKNAAFGPVSGHVFETPGTYVVNLIVMDGVNTTTKSVSITVQDPNVVYGGANTICISHSGNFAGAPAGAQMVNTAGNADIFAAFQAYKASNKRLLFCKGDAWTCTGQLAFSNLSNLIIDGYGTGVARSAKFGATSDTLISVTPSALNGSLTVVNLNTSDIKICNLKITAPPTTFAGAVNETVAGLLYYKIEIFGCAQGFNAYMNVVSNKKIMDQLCLYECLVDDLYGSAGFNPNTVSAAGASGSPGVFTVTGHPFKVGYKVRLTGTPPTPLISDTDYYISATNHTANTFSLSAAWAPDTPLALSGNGTCTVTEYQSGGGVAAFVSMVRGGVMGCYFDNCNHGEQTLRIPYVDRGHINNNYIARPNQTKNVVKIHSFIYDAANTTWSEKFVMTANVMDLRGGYSYDLTATPPITRVGDCSIVIGSGGNGGIGGEWVRNGIVQNNFTYSGTENPKDSRGFIGIGCPNITVRNNIADFSVGDRTTAHSCPYPYTGMYFASVATSTADQTVGVRIYNNTMYSNLANAEFANFVLIQASGTGLPVVDQVSIKNNLWYLPYHTNANRTAYRNSGGAGTNIVATNNTDDGQTALVSPNFTVTPPVALADWKPKAGSYAIGSGATVPVLSDFNQAPRITGANHMGAVLP